MKTCLAALFISLITWANNTPAYNFQDKESVPTPLLKFAATEKMLPKDEAKAHQRIIDDCLESTATDNFFDLGGTLKKTELATISVPPDDIPPIGNEYLSAFYTATDAEEPDFSLRNLLVLQELATLARLNEYLDPPLPDSSGEGLRMPTLRDALIFDADRNRLASWQAFYRCHARPTSNRLQINDQVVSPASDLEPGTEAKPAQFLSPLRQQPLDSARSSAKSAG